MDLQTLCIIVILAGVVVMMLRAIVAAGRKPQARPAQVRKKMPNAAFALDDALDKVNETIRILQDTLGNNAPGRHDPEGAKFYIAYLTGVTHEIAKMNRVPYGPALETPIRMEIIRLGLAGTTGGSDSLPRVLATDSGHQGFAAGELDGIDACNPHFRGTYFARIQTYFADAQVRGPR